MVELQLFMDGSKIWYCDGNIHRNNGHAGTYSNGSQFWAYHGLLHRSNGPAIINTDGRQEWYKHGQLHRSNGPAIVDLARNISSYWANGKCHRLDGPARTLADGSVEYWVDGCKLTEFEFMFINK